MKFLVTLFALLTASLCYAQDQNLSLRLTDTDARADIYVYTLADQSFPGLNWKYLGNDVTTRSRRVAALPLELSSRDGWTGPQFPGPDYDLHFVWPVLRDGFAFTLFDQAGYQVRDRIGNAAIGYHWQDGRPTIPAGDTVRTISRMAFWDSTGVSNGVFWASLEHDPLGIYDAYAETFHRVEIVDNTVTVLDPTPAATAAAVESFLFTLEQQPGNLDAMRAARAAVRALRKKL